MRKPHRIVPPPSKQDILRFWEKVRIRKPGECWPWVTGHCGRFCLGSRTDGSHQLFPAPRIAWVITNGPIPPGMNVCHRCDNGACCNPACLFLGSPKDNTADMDQKGRRNAPHGEQHWNSKFTKQDIRDIRRGAASGAMQKVLARKWKVDPSNISYIVRRKTWAHVV